MKYDIYRVVKIYIQIIKIISGAHKYLQNIYGPLIFYMKLIIKSLIQEFQENIQRKWQSMCDSHLLFRIIHSA